MQQEEFLSCMKLLSVKSKLWNKSIRRKKNWYVPNCLFLL